MSMNRILKKLKLDEKEFVIPEKIKDYSKRLYYDYDKVIKYLVSQGYLLRVFKDLFYIKDPEEIKKGKIKYSLLELVSKGLEFKRIDNWYFGLYTALKLNNINNNNHIIDYILNNRIFKRKPIIIEGHKFKFILFKDSLLNFGIIENKIRYSNLEKTILDFIYLWKLNRVHERKIILKLSEYMEYISIDKIMKYSEYYPETSRKILDKLI